MIKMFGTQNANVLEQRLIALDEEFRLKRISQSEMDSQKYDILNKLVEQGHSISAVDARFLENYNQLEFQRMEQIMDD